MKTFKRLLIMCCILAVDTLAGNVSYALTVDEFNAEVNARSTQTQTGLQQQINGQLAKIPPPIVEKPAPIINTQENATPIPATPNESERQDETPTLENNASAPPKLTPPPKVNDQPVTSTPAPSNNTFTGFGNGGTGSTMEKSKPASPASNPNGWNIKY